MSRAGTRRDLRRPDRWRPGRGRPLLGLLGLLVATAAQAQTPAPPDTTRLRTFVVEADVLEQDTETTRRLTGNVRVRQDSTFLSSRRAVEFRAPGGATRAVAFIGDVLIVERGDSLRADSVYYERRTKIGRAQGRVRLSDGEVQVLAPSGIYFSREKRARFEEGVTLIDSATTVTSRQGTYWSDDQRAELAGSVRLHAERSYLEADSLTYFREAEVSVARGDVFIERLGGEDEDAAPDSTIRTYLFGRHAVHDEQAGLSRFTGRPLLVQIRQDSAGADADTLAIRALRLEALDQGRQQRLVAVDSVRIWQGDFAAVADSVVSERLRPPADRLAADTLAPPPAETREETRLFGAPVAWLGASQVSGDTLRVVGTEGTVDSLFVRGAAFVAQRDSALDRVNQVRGRRLVGVFLPDSVRIFTVGPNAEALYFRRDDDGRLQGGVRASGDRVTFRFRGDEPEELFFPGAEGTYYDAGLLPEPFALDGFRWMPARRPSWPSLVEDPRVPLRIDARLRPPPVSPFEAIPPVSGDTLD